MTEPPRRSDDGRARYRRSCLLLALSAVVLGACGRGSATLDGELPIHLETHLDVAEVAGGEVPETGEPGESWDFPAAREHWRLLSPATTNTRITPLGDAVRLRLESIGKEHPSLSLVTTLPDWSVDDWEWIVVTLRASGAVRSLGLRFNRTDQAGDGGALWQLRGDEIPVIADGEEHSYRLRVRLRETAMRDAWRQLGLQIEADGRSEVELMKVEAIRTRARYGSQRVGVAFEGRDGTYRRVVFAHSPAAIRFPVRVPRGGRLDVGLGILDRREEVTFRVLAKDGRRDDQVLLDVTRSEPEGWDQRSIDLSPLAGRRIDLTLEIDATAPGTLGLWAAPTLSGVNEQAGPNVLLYVIDGAGADFTSLYGNPRPTTPFLEELASRGAMFERAFSNSSWTKPATSTLLTSLQHSALGGARTLADPLPEAAKTLPELLHAAGYLTAAFTSNPFAGRVSSFERGLDRLRDAYTGNNSISSKQLHVAFERWRHEYPGRPFYAHIQTTDVHRPHRPRGETAGLFLPPAERERFREWQRRLEAAGGAEPDSPAWTVTDLDREAFFDAQRRLYEECLAHNDARLAELVGFLEQEGEWDNTLLIVTADHGVRAAGLRLPGNIPSERVLASAYETRIPLVMTWPGRISEGVRISQPVSLIDLLPTVLDLLDLPDLDSAQGRSIVPGLVSAEGWSPRPVVLEELEVDPRTVELHGLLEVIDGRWAASLLIGDRPPSSGLDDPPAPRSNPFLLFDLEQDPWALETVHEERPELTRHYLNLLRTTWRDHLEVAERYEQGNPSELTTDQLGTLRSLGYVD